MIRILVNRLDQDGPSALPAETQATDPLEGLLGELHACRFQVKQAGNLLNQQVWLIRCHRVWTLEGRDEVIENLAGAYDALKSVIDELTREIRGTVR